MVNLSFLRNNTFCFFSCIRVTARYDQCIVSGLVAVHQYDPVRPEHPGDTRSSSAMLFAETSFGLQGQGRRTGDRQRADEGEIKKLPNRLTLDVIVVSARRFVVCKKTSESINTQ